MPVGETNHGVPPFLDQLIETLKIEQSEEPMESYTVSGSAGGAMPDQSEMGATSTLHGRDLSRRGYTVEQVVRDYGDLCQAITDLAVEMKKSIQVNEFRTLNRCLDNGISVAVTEFNYQQASHAADQQEKNVNVRMGMFGHELRNYLNTATLALTMIKLGDVGISGATGGILDRSLVGMRNLIDRSLAEVKIAAGIPLQHERFSLAELIAEVRLSAILEAQAKECALVVGSVDRDLALEADRDLILAAVGNLLQNAFKFTERRTEVTLNAYAVERRILIEVEDSGPGLPPGEAEKMFLPFHQGGENKSGMGLGLTICRRSVEASHGSISARNKPGGGCIFTIDLPRHALAGAS